MAVLCYLHSSAISTHTLPDVFSLVSSMFLPPAAPAALCSSHQVIPVKGTPPSQSDSAAPLEHVSHIVCSGQVPQLNFIFNDFVFLFCVYFKPLRPSRGRRVLIQHRAEVQHTEY